MKRPKQSSPVNRLTTWITQPRHAVFAAVLATILVAYIVLHVQASYTLPFPWLDESHFLWQANGFAEHFSLFSPELNSDRSILWMPPGYLVVLGTVIKIFGLSLDVGRALSLVMMLAAIGVIGVLIRRYSLPIVSIILAAPFVLGAPCVAAGNIARMEALLIFALLTAFLFLQRGRIVVGLCLLALTPLIHPNGLYFLISGVIAAALIAPRPWIWRRPSVGETFLIAFVVFAWVGYGVYALSHWNDFITDMRFQLERKAVRNIKDAVLTPGSLSLLAVTLVGAVYCYRKRLSAIFLLAVAVPAWWVAAAGIEMWYRVFFSLAYYFLAVVFLAVAYQLVRETSSRWKRMVFPALVIPVAYTAIGWNIMSSSFGEPLIFPDSRPWYKMTSGGAPYITEADKNKIRGVIEKLPMERTDPVVEFYPAGDAFFYTSPIRPRIRFSYPLFCTRDADWYIVHLSDRFTPNFNKYALELFERIQVNAADLVHYYIYTGANTDQWFLVPGVKNTEFRRKR